VIAFEVRPAETFPNVYIDVDDGLGFHDDTNPYPIVVAHDGKRLVGILSYSTSGSVVTVEAVWVTKSHRRRGLARQMLSLVRSGRREVAGEAVSTMGFQFLAGVGATIDDQRHLWRRK
jgi:GNAT superfamily N-acetyltransferase